MRPIIKAKFEDCSEDIQEQSLWRILAMIISALGLAIVIVTFLAEVVTLYRAEKLPGMHEFFLPFGLLLLYSR